MSALLAFRVEVDYMSAITFAPDSQAAKWNAVSAYWDAGFGREGRWPPGVSAVRRQEFDRFPRAGERPRQCWDETLVRDLTQ